MKNRRVPQLIALCWLAAMTLWPGSASAYDPPDFDFGVFSSDGIFLPVEQQSSLLEALAAIASNFTDNPRVDDDLREKALAISLRLDPMHYNSRLAHRQLANGSPPVATAYFDSLTVISETLWNLAKQLSSPPFQPDGVQIAPYLMEISLITHPQPPPDRLDLYAAVAADKFPLWEKFITLQAETNLSTTRTLSIRSEANAIFAMQKKRATEPTSVKSDSTPPPGPAPRPSASTLPVATSLTVFSSIVEVDGTPMAGRVSLMIRPPQSQIERDLLAAPGSSPERPNGANLPLIASIGGGPPGEIRLPYTFATERSWTWPAGAIGEVDFTPSGTGLSRRPATPPVVLPQAAVLVSSLLGKTSINDQFVLSGEMSDATSAPVIRDPVASASVAGVLGKKYLLMPASALQPLVISLKETGQLPLLFQTELISYTTLAEAIKLATSPTDPALIEASAAFDEIEAVSSRMSFSDLARNGKVQERLNAILTKCPNFLSARAMLEFGRLPLTAEMKVSEFAAQVEALIQPFANLEEIDALSSSEELISKAKTNLARLRLEVPFEARETIPPLEDFIEAIGLYLGLSNRSTSTGFQRLREASVALETLKTSLAPLGATVETLAQPTLIEGETLVNLSAVSGGETVAQQLGGGGSIFSEDRQLWWTGGSPGDTCSIKINGLEPGKRTVSLFMTTAFDYGIARITIGNLFKEIDFYSRNILIADPLVFDNVELDPGEPLTITLEIIGANPDAEPRYFLGLDRLEVK